MLRRSLLFRTVGIFPLHLDPPNLDHIRVFKQALSDPSLNLSKLILLPLSHQAVTLQKSLHLSAMAGLALREFEAIDDEALMQPGSNAAGAHQHGTNIIFAAADEDALTQQAGFMSVIGVDTAITEDGQIVSPTKDSAAKKKKVRVEVNFTALEMHEDRIGVLEQLIRDISDAELERRAADETSVAEAATASAAAATATTSQSSASASSSTNSRNSSSQPYSSCGVTLFQWLADVEFGGCLADRIWPRIADYTSTLPLTLLLPTGPAYPHPSDPVTETIVARVASRWHGPVSSLLVRREWSSGFVRRRLFEEEGKCNTLVSGPIMRYIDSHNLYRDERRQRQRYAAAVAENAIRLPLIPLDDVSPFGATSLHQQLGATSSGADDSGSSSYGDDSNVFPSEHATSRIANAPSGKWVSFAGSIPRLELHFDPRNALARHIYEQLKTFQVRPGEQPDLIVPIGGDGYLMKCVRKFWMRFIPFFGVNAGHVGFLLNDAGLLEEFFSAPLRLYQVSMLYCMAEKLHPASSDSTPLFGRSTDDLTESDLKKLRKRRQADMICRAFAFNDAWMERASGQTAKFRICVNNVERSRSVRGDGVLVSTAAGSTAYAQALGGSPMPIDTPILQLVGSNCTWPVRWRPVHLPEDVLIELESCDTDKRPCRAYVDSVDLGICKKLSIRASRVAGIQLAFTRSSDVQAKLYKMQFPSS